MIHMTSTFFLEERPLGLVNRLDGRCAKAQLRQRPADAGVVIHKERRVLRGILKAL